MSTPDSDDLPDPVTHGAAAQPAPTGEPTDDASDPEALAPVTGDERRGIGEWAVVLVLVALIVGVAWSQFGPLFETSTAGSGGPAPGPAPALDIEAEGVVLGGTAMSSLSDRPAAEPTPGEPDDTGDTDEFGRPDDQE